MPFIRVYDESTKEWRQFEVVPSDNMYLVKCGNGLHQIGPRSKDCACGKFNVGCEPR